jgi:WD40 repeat protein/uncharacterized caspase-like protein
MLRAAILAGLLLWGAPPAAAEDQPDASAPILRIETGMHGSVINRLAVTDDGKSLVTVSDDKTTRIWSLDDGAQQRVWRTPIGTGDAGALYAVAVSGDDMVVGGWTGTNDGTIYVFNLKTGALRGSIDKFKGAISALAFSKDGRYLAVADEGVSLTLIDFKAMKPKAVAKGFGGRINWIAFSSTGTLATTAQDGEIQEFDADLKELARAKLASPTGKPWGLAFSPEGSQLAVGDREQAVVSVFASQDLKPLQTLKGGAATAGALSVIAWSADNKLVAAAGSYRKADETRLVRSWPIANGGLGTPSDIPVASDTVTDLAILASGEIVYATAEPAFGVLGHDGQVRLSHRSRHPDFRDGRDQFRVSADGGVVDFPTAKGGKSPFRFDLIEGTLTKDPPARADVKPPVVADAALKPTDWLNSTAPKLAGRAVALEPNEHTRALAVLPGDKGAVLGTDFYLRAETATASLWKTVVPAPVWTVNATPDGRYVVAGLGDGTIRWFDSGDGHEVMNLFVDPADQRWVVWLPEGFFDHSEVAGQPGGETLVGYQLNHGPGHLADFVTIGQLYDKFYRRDLVLARFRGEAAQARMIDDQVSRTGDYRAVLKTGLPPAVKLLGFCVVAATDTGCPPGTGNAPDTPDQKQFTVTGAGNTLFARYEIDDRGGGLGKVVIRRNTAAIDGTRTTERSDAKVQVETVMLPLKDGANTISFSTVSANGSIESPPDDAVVINATPKAEETGIVTKLYAVVVGVSQYQQPDFRLANADNDARAIADVLSKPTPPVYAAADVTLLVNDDATSPKISAAIEHVAALAKPDDIVILFFAGHGEAVDNKYYFAPVDFAVKHPDEVDEAKHADAARQDEIIQQLFRQDGLGEATLFPLWARIQGNMLVVLDTCFSAGAATHDAVDQKAHNDTVAQGIGHDTGRFILAGARQEALDSPGTDTTVGGNHGLFTYWLLQGLQGKDPDVIRHGVIDVLDLMSYTKQTVAAESRKIHQEQVPKMQYGGNDRFAIRAAGGN